MRSTEKITLPWQDLREWDGSVRKAFEQMCNQFASCEDVPVGSRFIPVAAPDGGVEGYWIYPNEDEWGFQAKFWTSPEQVDFAQLDSSIQRAFKTHPRLTRYTVCLPIDRQDPRKPSEMWLKDHWDKHETKWRGWALAEGRTIEFGYWGETELTSRFSMEKHAGRYYFWFHKELFSDQWFKERLEEAVNNVGVRYTPDLNVAVGLSEVFDALVRGDRLRASIKTHLFRIRKVSSFRATPEIEFAATEASTLTGAVGIVLDGLSRTLEIPVSAALNFGQFTEPISKALTAAFAFVQSLRIHEDEKRKAKAEASSEPDIVAIGRLRSMFDGHLSATRELTDALHELHEFVDGEAAQAAQVPALLLTGSAGMGKTHLLCDFALSQVEKRAPVVLLLGQQFLGADPPLSQSISLLGIHARDTDFLGALNAAGQLRGVPAVLVIDAINEGQGRRLWHPQLAGVLTAARRYPYLRLVFSVRQTYLEACVPEHLPSDQLLRVEHHGFAGHVIDAVTAFFDYYGIVLPSAPIFDPEFENPLFLKIFCKSLHNRGQKTVPKGMSGVNSIFTSFIDSIDEKLSHSDQLDFPRASRVVLRATNQLADAMSASGLRAVPFADAEQITKGIYPSTGYERSLLRHLISEGLLSQDMGPNGVESIQFAYEKMSDYLIARRLVDQHFDPQAPEACFLPNAPMHFLIEDQRAASLQQGLLEALSVHLPEVHAVELADCVGSAREFRAVRSAFTMTFALRSEEAFHPATDSYLNSVISRYQEDRYQLNEALINLAALTGHPFNAERLHRALNRLELPVRDGWWTAGYLWESFNRRGAARRLVEWVTGESNLGILDDSARYLIGLALGWMLTSSNRAQRDTATKGLVRLFTDHLRPLLTVLQKLADVNDPYVVERILAAAYGSAMRTTDSADLALLAQWVYDRFFAARRPPANIMIRDYARGVVELALHRGVPLKVEPKNIRPPYLSDWPETIASREELEAAYGWHKDQDEETRHAWYSIFDSVMEHGDFARYVIGTNWGSFPFLSTPLTEPRPKNASRYAPDDSKPFDLDIAQRWIFDRVVKLGWTPERFATFDRSMNQGLDRADKPERIGKKYQWIAYYEFVARVADNFHFASDPSDPGSFGYEGPWQITSARNIDPSSLLTRSLSDQETSAWWLSLNYALQPDGDLDRWLRNQGDVPELAPMLEVVDPADGTRWLVLEGSYKVTDPKPEGEDRFDHSFRQVWIEVRAYLVKKRVQRKVFDWFGKQNFWGRWMHENHPDTSVFLGEYFWSPAYRAVDNEYHSHPGWSREGKNDVPHQVGTTCAFYLHERSYDCSVEEGINVTLPSKLLSDGLGLQWSGLDGVFNDQHGRRAAFDPSVTSEGPGALLVRRDLLEEYLEAEGLVLMWAAFGGKQYMQNDRDRNTWKGEMQMNGAYRLTREGIEGRFRGTFRTRV